MLLLRPSHGQNFIYPSINSNGYKLSDFVPLGWSILDSAKGDLNKDGINDAAIILEYNDSITFVKSREDTVLTQPRMLLILFKTALDNNFRVAAQSNSFILNHDSPAMDDPYQELKIDKGVLRIRFHMFYNIGSWYVTNTSYKFRYQQGEFILIGADYYSFHRASLDFEEYSYNFLTKKRSFTKGNDNKGTKKTTWKSVKISMPKTLKTFKEPFTWEVEKDLYL
ncbi:MAG: hypothetical protein H7122_18140 [Chitinophagaceae bacterium]|nr:hypothetical protein [Chitinophagaceae bacterium]